MANSKSDCICVHCVHQLLQVNQISISLAGKWSRCRGQGRLDPPLSSPDIQSAEVAWWSQSEALGWSLYVSSVVIITVSISCSQVSHNNLLISLPFLCALGLQSFLKKTVHRDNLIFL